MTVLLGLMGGVGAILRFLVDSAITQRNSSRIPLGTLVVNLTGSLLLGLLTGWASHGSSTAEDVQLVLGTGFCGGFTTFSTASVESVRLLATRRLRLGISYAAATLILCCAIAWAGLALTG